MVTQAQRDANRRHDAKRDPERQNRAVLLRLSEGELLEARALRAEGETLAGLFRRLLRERVE